MLKSHTKCQPIAQNDVKSWVCLFQGSFWINFVLVFSVAEAEPRYLTHAAVVRCWCCCYCCCCCHHMASRHPPPCMPTPPRRWQAPLLRSREGVSKSCRVLKLISFSSSGRVCRWRSWLQAVFVTETNRDQSQQTENEPHALRCHGMYKTALARKKTSPGDSTTNLSKVAQQEIGPFVRFIRVQMTIR